LKLGGIIAPLLILIGASTSATAGAACDLTRGRQVFETKCTTCHTAAAGAAHAVGPNLHGVIGRPAAAAKGFNYSEALSAWKIVWTRERLLEFLEDPLARVPGTFMAFSGVRRAADRESLVCYLESL
jgi:cytochrome c